MYFDTPGFDLQLFRLINQQGHFAVLNWLMITLSSKTALFALFVPALLLAVRRCGKRQLVLFAVLLLGMGITDMSTSAVKSQVQRVRPLNSQPGTYCYEDGAWVRRPPDFQPTKTAGTSYPSGHAANTMCLALLALRLWPRMRPSLRGALLALPLLVGYSRVYLGKHYPTDVLAGWLFGMVIAVLVGLAWKEWGEKRFPGLQANCRSRDE
ncbi:phosphatase PAP2 family protein [Paucidesulfovibrio longus]|uniref:phosphatase PAP2 family protein n=1 Tax=Paucidesulfovibrio longus TaxID=889 RepID=UPI0003B7A468|nr:phosphatase PAP2 family protein [Paucidesulfovibrio longus]